MKFSEEIIVFLWNALTSQIAWHLDIKLGGHFGHYLLMHMEPGRDQQLKSIFREKSKILIWSFNKRTQESATRK